MTNFKARKNAKRRITLSSFETSHLDTSPCPLFSRSANKFTGDEEDALLQSVCSKNAPPVNLSGTLWAGRPSDVKMFLPELWISCSASLRWKWRCTMRCSHCYFLCAVCMNNNYNIYNVGN